LLPTIGRYAPDIIGIADTLNRKNRLFGFGDAVWHDWKFLKLGSERRGEGILLNAPPEKLAGCGDLVWLVAEHLEASRPVKEPVCQMGMPLDFL